MRGHDGEQGEVGQLRRGSGVSWPRMALAVGALRLRSLMGTGSVSKQLNCAISREVVGSSRSIVRNCGRN